MLCYFVVVDQLCCCDHCTVSSRGVRTVLSQESRENGAVGSEERVKETIARRSHPCQGTRADVHVHNVYTCTCRWEGGWEGGRVGGREGGRVGGREGEERRGGVKDGESERVRRKVGGNIKRQQN